MKILRFIFVLFGYSLMALGGAMAVSESPFAFFPAIIGALMVAMGLTGGRK